MAMETFCGKSCNECMLKEQLSCTGCQSGPGRSITGDCKIAGCCREKGHESCSTCSFLQSCWTIKEKDRMPEQRLREQERHAEERRKLDERAPIIGKWLWLLFWLVVPGTISGLMVVEQVVEFAPALRIPGHILGLACNFAYAWFLFKLEPFVDRYRIAALCTVVGTVIVHAVNLIGFGQDNPLWWLLMIPAMAISYVGCYQEFHAHAEILEGVDSELSGKWRTLWKWFIGVPLSIIGCILIMLIIPILGLLIMLAALIAMCVISIVQLVYLYRTAQRFRSHVPEEPKALPEAGSE